MTPASGPEETSDGAILARVWDWWKHVARRIGTFQARLLLGVFYFVIFAPFALAVRWGADPLALRPGRHPVWQHRVASESESMVWASRQF